MRGTEARSDLIFVFCSLSHRFVSTGIPPTPVKLVREYLAKHGRVVLVGEWGTSKTCSQCDSEMQLNVTAKTTFHCTNVCKVSWHRDVNAARNIARLFRLHMAGLPRPASMTPHPH